MKFPRQHWVAIQSVLHCCWSMSRYIIVFLKNICCTYLKLGHHRQQLKYYFFNQRFRVVRSIYNNNNQQKQAFALGKWLHVPTWQSIKQSEDKDMHKERLQRSVQNHPRRQRDNFRRTKSEKQVAVDTNFDSVVFCTGTPECFQICVCDILT